MIRHDQTNKGVAQMLIDMSLEEWLPVSLGVIFQPPGPTYERAVVEQNREPPARARRPTCRALISKGQTWRSTNSRTKSEATGEPPFQSLA